MDQIFSYLAGAKDLYDVVSGIYGLVRRGKDDDRISPELKRSLLGNPSKAQDVSARLSQMLSKRAVPFILRLGNNFRLPADITKMEEAILKKDIWDWTYVFGWKENTRMDVGSIEYLRRLYSDPKDSRFVRPDAATTCLHLFSTSLDEEFGGSFYIAGVALTSSQYEQIFDIPKEDLLPNVVIKVDQEIIAYTDPLAMNFMMFRAVDFIFKTFSQGTGNSPGFIYSDPSPDKPRPLSREMQSALRIGD